jgi:bifunctional DNA-binding transcriptional regulator/antitoxin component of YhaV-PrlF toxin-antitoxin module
MNTKIVKTTSKGQITLPQKWRNQFETENYILEMHNEKIIVTPIVIKPSANDEVVVFDADRDNDGKGVSVDEMINLLKKL